MSSARPAGRARDGGTGLPGADGRDGLLPRAAAFLLLLVLLLLPAGCVTEYYQILDDWTGDDARDGVEDAADTESDGDVEHPEGEDDAAVADGDDEDGAAPVCVEETDGGLPCPTGFVCCEADPVSFCYDLSSDPDHCGSCDLECESGRECVSGRCAEP